MIKDLSGAFIRNIGQKCAAKAAEEEQEIMLRDLSGAFVFDIGQKCIAKAVEEKEE